MKHTNIGDGSMCSGTQGADALHPHVKPMFLSNNKRDDVGIVPYRFTRMGLLKLNYYQEHKGTILYVPAK